MPERALHGDRAFLDCRRLVMVRFEEVSSRRLAIRLRRPPVEQRVSCPNGLKRGCSLLSVASRSSQCSHFGALSSSISGVEVCSLWFGTLLAGQVWQFRAERRLAGQDLWLAKGEEHWLEVIQW